LEAGRGYSRLVGSGDDRQAQKRVKACCDLTNLLQPSSIAFVCVQTGTGLDWLSAKHAVSHIITSSRTWKYTTIYDTFRPWTTFFAWPSTWKGDLEESPTDQISLLLATDLGREGSGAVLRLRPPASISTRPAGTARRTREKRDSSLLPVFRLACPLSESDVASFTLAALSSSCD
jgi:hypothetical protein